MGLRVQNYMRISDAELSFAEDESVVAIAGKNEQGKTTLVDAVWDALANRHVDEPVRRGESEAELSVSIKVWPDAELALRDDLQPGEPDVLSVVRTIKGARDVQRRRLTVRRGDGKAITAPQKTLERALLFASAQSIDGVIVLDDAVQVPVSDVVPAAGEVIRTRIDLITAV